MSSEVEGAFTRRSPDLLSRVSGPAGTSTKPSCTTWVRMPGRPRSDSSTPWSRPTATSAATPRAARPLRARIEPAGSAPLGTGAVFPSGFLRRTVRPHRRVARTAWSAQYPGVDARARRRHLTTHSQEGVCSRFQYWARTQRFATIRVQAEILASTGA